MNQTCFSMCVSLVSVFLMNISCLYADEVKLALGTKIDKHELKNKSDNFIYHDGRVWAQAEFTPSKKETVTFVWTRDSKPYVQIKTSIKFSPRYRTQAYVTAHPGVWHVAVKSESGVILAEKNFSIEGRGGIVDTHLKEKPQSENANKKVREKTIKVASAPTIKEKSVSGIAEALKAINPTESQSLANKESVKKNSVQKPVQQGNIEAKIMTSKA